MVVTKLPPSLQKAIDKVNKDRDIRIASLADTDGLHVEAVPIGNVALDWLTGVGGFPRGRLVELFGPPSSGKTTTAIMAAVNAQKMGLRVLYLDYEQAMDPKYCEFLGLDLDALLFSQPDTLESGVNAMRDLVNTGEIGVVFLDSLAAMTSEKEVELEVGDMKFSARDKARIMAQMMRIVTPELSKTNTMLIILNHVQDLIPQGMFEQRLAAQGRKRTTTPGGTAKVYYASVRIEFKPIGNERAKRLNPTTNKMEDMIVYGKIQATAVKNKVGPPYRAVELRTELGKGISNEWTILSLLTGYGIIEVKNGVYRFDEPTMPLFQEKDFIKGEDNMLTAMRLHPEWTGKLAVLATEALNSSKEVVVPADTDVTDVELEELLSD